MSQMPIKDTNPQTPPKQHSINPLNQYHQGETIEKQPESYPIEKIDVESLIKDFKITSHDNFNVYLQQLSQDLCSQSDNPGLGINKITFLNYFQLPGIIGERLYSVFNLNQSDYLEIDEFINGMTTLYTEDFESLAKFVFNLYDFDKNGLISKEDIRIVLSYIPLTLTKGNCHKKEFSNIVESQEELNDLIEKCFKVKTANVKHEEGMMDYKAFYYTVQNVSSEIVLYILIYLLNKRPFSKETLKQYDNIILRGISTPTNIKKIELTPSLKILVPSPSLKSKFSSSLTIKHSPYMKAQKAKSSYLNSKLLNNNLLVKSKNVLSQLTQKHPPGTTSEGKSPSFNSNAPTTISLPIPMGSSAEKPITANTNTFSLSNQASNPHIDDLDSFAKLKRIKKKVNSTGVINQTTTRPTAEPLESIDESDNKIKNNHTKRKNKGGFLKEISKDDPLPSSIMKMNITNDNETSEDIGLMAHQANQSNEDMDMSKAFKYNYNNLFLDKVIDEEEEDMKDAIEEEARFEGYLYKIFRMKRVKQRYFKLIHKDLYTYEHKGDSNHKGLHNLSGVFIEQCDNCEVNGKNYFSFRLIFTKKTRYYYCENEDEYKSWVIKLRSVTGFSNLSDLYMTTKRLGKGKFASVKLGKKNTTGEEFAIKIINKEAMISQDLELARTEIEIMKISKHPYIVKLHEVFENRIYIYIIMEYCRGGDMFSYLEKRNFKIAEPRAAELTYQIMTALYYLHSFGIVHRDLKLENIMMSDDSETSDIRIVDFGLSKLIGPNEKCTESYGTLGYVAPEVLTEQPYDKSADAWSLGIVAYLLITGCLPYDDDDNPNEIIRQTIYDPVPFPKSLWKNFSLEAKSFVHNLLQKNPKKRMTVKEAMDHPWLKRHDQIPGATMNHKGNAMSDFKIYTHVHTPNEAKVSKSNEEKSTSSAKTEDTQGK